MGVFSIAWHPAWLLAVAYQVWTKFVQVWRSYGNLKAKKCKECRIFLVTSDFWDMVTKYGTLYMALCMKSFNYDSLSKCFTMVGSVFANISFNGTKDAVIPQICIHVTPKFVTQSHNNVYTNSLCHTPKFEGDPFGLKIIKNWPHIAP